MINLTVESSAAYAFGLVVAATPVASLCQELHRGTVPQIAYVMHNEWGGLQIIALEVTWRRQRCEMVIWNIHFLFCVSVF